MRSHTKPHTTAHTQQAMNKVELARQRFLELVRVKTPAFKDLSGETFKLFKDAGVANRMTRTVWVQLVEASEPCSSLQLQALRAQLLEWQKKWNLVESSDAPKWVLATAVYTLIKWQADSDYLSDLRLGFPQSISIKQDLQQDKRQEMADNYLFDYLLCKKSREEFFADKIEPLASSPLFLLGESEQRKIIHKVEQAADNLCNEVELLDQAQAVNPAKLMPNRTHLKWSVVFQTDNESKYERIAKEAEVEKQAVRQAIKKTLEFIGLREREDINRGRPQGSKDSKSRHRITK